MANFLNLAQPEPFNVQGDPNTVDQRWKRWKKSFEFYIVASNITEENQRRALFERHRLHSTEHKQGESIDQFITRLRQISINCDYNEEENNIFRDLVVAKTRSGTLRKKCLLEKELTLEKVIEYGKMLEAISYQIKKIEGDTSKPADNELINKLHVKNSRGSGNKLDKEYIKCGRCGYKGHLSKDCERSRTWPCHKRRSFIHPLTIFWNTFNKYNP